MSARTDLRVLLYSHDSWGLGHLRRSLAIAHALARGIPGASMLIATGSPNATSFPLAPGVEILKLPSVTKDGAGAYQPRQLNGSLTSVVQLRSALLMAAFTEFSPDILIVDHQLVGMSEEVLPLLEQAKRIGTYCVYGMRDVLDCAQDTERAWQSDACQWALKSGYDEIWVYGDQAHFATADFYPTLRRTNIPLTYTGLITNGKVTLNSRPSDRPHVLATVGGGEDGGTILLSLLQGMLNREHTWDTTVVTGPLLGEREQQEVVRLAGRIPGVTVHHFHDSIPGLMRSCDLVVSMAGYNTCAELAAARRPAILIPRTTPRQEQLIRANYLSNSGNAACLVSPSPDQLYTTVGQQLTSAATGSFPNTDGLNVVTARCRHIAGVNPADNFIGATVV